MIRSTFEEVIRRDGKLIYTNVGDSMYPLIKPHDLLVIQQITAPLRRLDVPLYKRDNGQYVLHRIIKVRAEDYLICGDNRYDVEEGITDRHMIGVLTDIIRGDRMLSLYSPRMRLYAHLWCDCFPLRKFVLRIRRVLRRIGRRAGR